MTDFAPGQRWTYHTRPGEETSTLLILGRDTSVSGLVGVSVRVQGVTLHPSGQVAHELSHAPLTEAGLRLSVLDLLEEGVPLPSDLSGYEAWRPAFERGETGAFDVTLSEVLDMIDRAGQDTGPATQNPLFQKQNGR